jgi:hypothetical protein
MDILQHRTQQDVKIHGMKAQTGCPSVSLKQESFKQNYFGEARPPHKSENISTLSQLG